MLNVNTVIFTVLWRTSDVVIMSLTKLKDHKFQDTLGVGRLQTEAGKKSFQPHKPSHHFDNETTAAFKNILLARKFLRFAKRWFWSILLVSSPFAKKNERRNNISASFRCKKRRRRRSLSLKLNLLHSRVSESSDTWLALLVMIVITVVALHWCYRILWWVFSVAPVLIVRLVEVARFLT